MSESWTPFALDNGSPHLVSEQVLGRPLLSFISDSETSHLYEAILQRVRGTGTPVVVTLRCDSPSLRRFLRLTISRLPGEEIEFVSHTLQTEPRESMALLDPLANRSSGLLVMCSWCKRIRNSQEGWMEVEEAVEQLKLFSLAALPQLSHGICPACNARVLESLKAK